MFGGYAEPMRYAGVTMSLVFLVGLAALPFAPETKGKPLPNEIRGLAIVCLAAAVLAVRTSAGSRTTRTTRCPRSHFPKRAVLCAKRCCCCATARRPKPATDWRSSANSARTTPNARAHLLLGKVYLRQGKPQAAEEHLRLGSQAAK